MTAAESRAEIETINRLLDGEAPNEELAMEWRDRKKELEEYLDELGGVTA